MRCLICNEIRHSENARFCMRCGAELRPGRDLAAGVRVSPTAGNDRGARERSDAVRGGVRMPRMTFNANGVRFDMILVEGGTFYKGITPGMASRIIARGTDWRKLNYPQVTVCPFYIADVTVTQRLWMAVMAKTGITQSCWRESMGSLLNPSSNRSDDELPVENVSWDACQEFISNLNELLNSHFRLPSEDEWEFAARGGNASRGYEHSGGNDFSEVGWDYGGTHRGGLKTANELGIHDMSGNIGEWCSDGYEILCMNSDSCYYSEVRLTPENQLFGGKCHMDSDWQAYLASPGSSYNVTHHIVRGFYDPRRENMLTRVAYASNAKHGIGLRLALSAGY